MSKNLLAAARRGDADAQCQLAAMLASKGGQGQNVERAFEWYEKAAKQRHPDATYNLALMYLNGEGARKNRARALRLLQLASGLGSIDADELLAEVRMSGRLGVGRNPKMAALHLIRALGRGSGRAASLLATALKKHELDTKSVVSALKRFSVSGGIR